jgi:ribosomal protein L31E
MFKKNSSTPQPFIGSSVDKGHIKKAMSDILDKGEILLGAFHGLPMKSEHGQPMGGIALHHYLLVTDRRVVFWGRGMMSSATDAFYYDDIFSVEGSQQLLVGEIVLNVRGAKERFTSMVKKDAPVAAKMIREQVDKHRQTKNQPIVPIVTESIPDQIKKLAELRNAGILTEVEFQKKKAELLTRL